MSEEERYYKRMNEILDKKERSRRHWNIFLSFVLTVVLISIVVVYLSPLWESH